MNLVLNPMNCFLCSFAAALVRHHTTPESSCICLKIHIFFCNTQRSILNIMLVCPRCSTSNLPSRRSLSTHLNKHCTGPTFLSNALTNGTSFSRTIDGRHPLSVATTSHQQARCLNAPEAYVTVPTINTLHAMPSMSHLSSTQTKLAQSHLCYADFNDADFSQDNDNHNLFSVDSVDNIIIEKCSFLRNSFQLPPDIAFQVHCLSVMSQNRGNDVNMFNQVIQCISGHSLHHSVDFRTLHVMSRDQLLQYLCNYYRLDFLKPTLHNVALSDGSVATVPIFDVKEILLSFLNDPGRMRKENLAPNYDPFTSKSTITNPPLDEIHTGSLWAAACQKYCGNHPNAFPMTLVCFYDKLHTDLHGSLACAPFIFEESN